MPSTFTFVLEDILTHACSVGQYNENRTQNKSSSFGYSSQSLLDAWHELLDSAILKKHKSYLSPWLGSEIIYHTATNQKSSFFGI